MSEPCTFLTAGELSAVVGDDTPRGPGGRQYSGLWSLTHRACNASPFLGAYAGLIAGAHRGSSPTLERIDDRTARLVKTHDKGPIRQVVGTYRLAEPHHVDYTYEVTFSNDDLPDCSEHTWCCYMNSPQESTIHFIENNVWSSYNPTFHGAAAMLHPVGLPDDRRAAFEQRTGDARFREQKGFHESFSGRTFDYPFYFGRLHGMVLMLMADHHHDFRFFVSPSGGGTSSIPGRTSPAWDFMWMIWHPQPGETRTLNVRLAFFREGGIAQLPPGAWAEWEAFRQLYPVK